MSKPNKTVAAFKAKTGMSAAAKAATVARQNASETMEDMEAVLSGRMTREEFNAKWSN